MYKNKTFYFMILMFCLITIIPFISAQPPFQQSPQEAGFLIIESAYPSNHKVNMDFYVHIHVYNGTDGQLINSNLDCNYHFYNHQIEGGQHISIGTLEQIGAGYSRIVNGSLLNQTGEYSVLTWCNSTSEGGFLKYTFDLTPSGKINSITKVFAYITLLFFLILIILTFYYTTRNINYEQWHNNIVKKYESKNIVRVIISSIGYNVMKNSFIWYYLFGLPIILLITDIAYVFGVESMIYLMQIILSIYYFGFLVVAIFFFGYIQEWFAYIVEEIKSLDYGV